MYIVMESSAKMPSSCNYPYAKIAVVQLTQEYTAKNMRPAMISERARGVLRVVRVFAPVPANGKTEKSGYWQTIKSARQMAHDLNNVADMATAEQIIGAGGSA